MVFKDLPNDKSLYIVMFEVEKGKDLCGNLSMMK